MRMRGYPVKCYTEKWRENDNEKGPEPDEKTKIERILKQDCGHLGECEYKKTNWEIPGNSRPVYHETT